MPRTAHLPTDTVESDRTKPQIEMLLIELSARFIRIPDDQVACEIERAQRAICHSLGFDRSSLWQECPDDRDAFIMTHLYQRSTMPATPMRPDARFYFPWTLGQLRQGKTVVIAGLDDLPADAARDAEMFRRYGTAAVVVVPLPIGNSELAALTFATDRERAGWPEEVVKMLKLVAEVVGSAIARERSDRRQRENEQRLRAIIETATDGIVVIDEGGSIESINPAAVRMFGYEAEDVIDRNVSMLMPEPYRTDHDGYLESYLKTGEKRIIGAGRELVGRRRDGSEFPMELAVSETVLDTGRRVFTGIMRDITARKQAEEDLRHSLDEAQRLRDQLGQHNVNLKEEVKLLKGHGRIVGQSQSLKSVLGQVEQVAPTRSTVLLLGETGTGKELIASAIHEGSPRRDHPMVRVNCSAIPTTLIESELFGREKGAYTDAQSRQIGRFEQANESTLFLDEIGDLASEMQVKLLRVLEERHIQRLGGSTAIPIDVRIIAATNVDLEKAVAERRFREDLYYRMNVFPIRIPPLRERPDDILPLLHGFVEEFGRILRKRVESVADESVKALTRYDWPGNVRELRNLVERAMILADGPELRIDVPGLHASASRERVTLHDAERDHIVRMLERAGWRVRGRNGAADLLDVKPTTLESRMARLGITRPERVSP